VDRQGRQNSKKKQRKTTNKQTKKTKTKKNTLEQKISQKNFFEKKNFELIPQAAGIYMGGPSADRRAKKQPAWQKLAAASFCFARLVERWVLSRGIDQLKGF
jgi:hypothetical protein